MKLQDIRIGAPARQVTPVEGLISTAKRLEEQGFDSLWFIDHLMGWYPQSVWTPDLTELAKAQKNPHIQLDAVAAIAVAGMSTSTLLLGTGVTECIRRHPAMLAQEFLTLDHITKGRVILGLGAGESENLIPYGLDFSQPVSKLEEGIKIIRLLWENDEPVDYEGRFWKLKDAVVGMGPYQEGKYPPIWLAAHGPRMLEMTGRLADGWLPIMTMTPDEYGKMLSLIRQAAAASGRDPQAITPGLWNYVVIDQDHETCHRLMEALFVKALCLIYPAQAFNQLGYQHPLGAGFYGLRDYIPARFNRQQALEAIGKVPREVAEAWMFHGTPEEVAAQIAPYAAQGMAHLMLYNITFMGDPSKIGSSYRLMAKLVKYIKGRA